MTVWASSSSSWESEITSPAASVLTQRDGDVDCFSMTAAV